MSELHYMYRLYDNERTLLYLGIAYSPLERIHQHARKPWADEVTAISISEMGEMERYAALRMEAEAIRSEHPRP